MTDVTLCAVDSKVNVPALNRPRSTDPAIADYVIGAAYHESGHAVVAYTFHGRLGPAGVTIDGDWYCDGRYPRSYPEWARIPYDLAGICAEFQFLDEIEPFASREEIDKVIYRIALGEAPISDLDFAMVTLRRSNPCATAAELYSRYRKYVEATYDMLQQPMISLAVNLVARRLLRCGRLSGDEVMKLYHRVTRRSRR